MQGRTLVALLGGALVVAGGLYLLVAARSSSTVAPAVIDAAAPLPDAVDPKLRGKRPAVPVRVVPPGTGDGSAAPEGGLPKPRVDLRGIALRDAGAGNAAAPPVTNSLDPSAEDAGVDEAPPDAAVRLKGR